jgi:hypothetical protein
VSDLATGYAGLTNHDRQTDRDGTALEEDVPLDLEAKLLIVGVIRLRARLKVHRAVLGVGLKKKSRGSVAGSYLTLPSWTREEKGKKIKYDKLY